MTHRIPPHNDEAERAVLGSILMSNDTLDTTVNKLSPSHFYRDNHVTIFEHMRRMHERSEMIDVLTLADSLKLSGELATVGGANFLAKLARNIPSTVNAPQYAEIVQRKAQTRGIIAGCTQALADLYDETDDHDALVEGIQRDMLALTSPLGATTGPVHISAHIKSHLAELEATAKGEAAAFVSTGIQALDDIIIGLGEEHLVILSGRPGMGKTAVAGEIILNVAQQGVPVCMMSLEMSSEALAQRMLCSTSRVNTRAATTGRLTGAEWQRYIAAVQQVSQYPIYIDDTGGLELRDLCSRLRRCHAEHGMRIAVIDYLQLINVRGVRKEIEAIAQISKALKALAKELKITVIALAQLNRDVEKREDKRPRSSDLRASGQIEQDADAIIGLYRDVVYNEDSASADEIELCVTKCRHDKPGHAVCRWYGEYSSIKDLSE